MKMKMKMIALLSLCMLHFFTDAAIAANEPLDSLWKFPERSAKQLVSKMSFEEKLGQMLMLDFQYWGVDAEKNKMAMTKPNLEIANIIKHYHLGSVILFRQNLIDTRQTITLINALQHARSNLPLFISIDQEGGCITRLCEGTNMPGNMTLGATRSTQLSELVGMIHGYELASLGFNFNFAPVVDVNNNQRNPVIGVRSYSDRAGLITEMASSYIKGMHKYPILTAIKHFPGHGNVTADSHTALPIVKVSKNAWHKLELVPFMHTMPVTDAIMSAHIVVPSLGNRPFTTIDSRVIGVPATFSKPIMTDLLRNRLHYTGLLITDAMNMGAITNYFDGQWAIKQAILAGHDIILMPLKIADMESVSKLDQLYRYLKTEAENDPELHRRIDESSYRVVLSKLKNKISANDKPIQQALQVVGSTIHKDIENMVSESAITLIENKDILPFQLKDNNKIVVFSDQQSRNALIEKHLLDIAKELNIHIAIQGSVIKMMSNDQSEDALTEKIKGQDLVILATYNLMKDPINAQRILNVANRNAIPAVVIATCKPYDIAYLNSVKANIAIYGITGFDITNKNINSLQTNIRSGLRTLFLTPDKRLMNTPIGKLPIDIKTPDLNRVLYPYGHGLTY